MVKPYYLYITPFFPSPKSWRGAVGSDFVAELKRCQQKWQVEVFVPGAGEDYEFQGIRVHRFPVRELPSALFPFLFKGFNQQSFLRKVAACGIKIGDIAVCHGNTAFFSIYPLAVKKLNARCLTLLQHHDLSSFGLTVGRLRHFWPYKVYLFPQLRRLHEQIDCHVFISEASRRSFLMAPDASWTVFDDYRRQMSGLDFYRPAKIKDSLIVHNGVNRSAFTPQTPNFKLQTSNSKLQTSNFKLQTSNSTFTIGCVGNFRDLKDQETLIRACGRVCGVSDERCGVRVVFVGSGETLDACKRLASEVEQKVNNSTVDLDLRPRPKLTFEFRTEVSHEALADFYRELDLFVLPSYFEGFGCVFTEAWACGVPFISAKGQGIEDMLAPEDRENWLIEPHDDRRLAELISSCMNGPIRQELVKPVYTDEIVPNFVKEIEGRL